MGTSSYNPQIFTHQLHKWEQFTKSKLRCKQDNIIGEFQLIQNINDFDIQCYILRTFHQSCLINVLALYQIGKNNMRHIEISGILPKYRHMLIGQNICYRLPDLGSLSYQDALYILSQALKAIPILYTLFNQGFYIEEQAIGINEKGKCKFWVNADYSSNTLQTLQQNIHTENGQFQITLGNQQTSNNCCPRQSRSNKTKKIERTLQNIIQKLQNRVMPTMSKQQQRSYKKQKIKHLTIKSDTLNINSHVGTNMKQKQNINGDKSMSMSKKKVKTDVKFEYSMENVGAWIKSMCIDAGVDKDYKVQVGNGDECPIEDIGEQFKNTVNKINTAQEVYELTNTKQQSRELSSPTTTKTRSNIKNCRIIAQTKTSLRRNRNQQTNQRSQLNSNYSLTKTNKNQLSKLLKASKQPQNIQFSYQSSNDQKSMTNSKRDIIQKVYPMCVLEGLHHKNKKDSANSQLSIKTGETTNAASQHNIIGYKEIKDNKNQLKTVQKQLLLLETPKSRFSYNKKIQSFNFPSREQQCSYNSKSSIQIKGIDPKKTGGNDTIVENKGKPRHKTQAVINYDGRSQKYNKVLNPQLMHDSHNIYFYNGNTSEIEKSHKYSDSTNMNMFYQLTNSNHSQKDQPRRHMITNSYHGSTQNQNINITYTNPSTNANLNVRQGNQLCRISVRQNYSNLYSPDFQIL